MADQPTLLLVLGPSTGGVGTHVLLLARELRDRGLQVTVCGPESTRDAFDWDRTGAPYRSAPVGVIGPVAAVRGRSPLRRLAAEHDVVHVHGTRAAAAVATYGVRPFVATWHNAPVGGRLLRTGHLALERVAAHGATVTLGASPDLVGRARRAGAVDARFLPVVAPPLPSPARSRADVRRELGVGERPLLLALARLAPQKRLDLLVDATAGWADDPAGPVVAVAGAGPLAGSLAQRAERARSPLVLLGHRDDPADLLAAADLAVLPSDWEARPLVVQEALRAGVPVVATDVGGVRELVGDAAVLVGAGDVGGLRRALDRLVGDAPERAALAARGRERAHALPSVADMVEALLAVYTELGGPRR